MKHQPFTTSEDDYFSGIFGVFAETPKMMSDDTVKRRIFSRYERQELEIKTILQVKSTNKI